MTEIPERADIPGEAQPDESNFVVAARQEVNKLINANRVNRRVIRLLAAVTAIVMITCGVLGYVAADQRSTDGQLRQENTALHQQNIVTCQAGNSYRSGQTQIWDEFIAILVNKNTPQSTLNIAHKFLKYVDRVDALRNCAVLYPVGDP